MQQLVIMIVSTLFGYLMGSIAATLGADGALTAAVVITTAGLAGGWLMRRSLA
jgi:Mg/Co/Ni transporter MgtE